MPSHTKAERAKNRKFKLSKANKAAVKKLASRKITVEAGKEFKPSKDVLTAASKLSSRKIKTPKPQSQTESDPSELTVPNVADQPIRAKRKIKRKKKK